MKNLSAILMIIFFISCNENKKTNNLNTIKIDSLETISYKFIKTDSNITNTTSKKIKVIFNSVGKFLGAKKAFKYRFNTECMDCEPINVFNQNILFYKQLLVKSTNAIYYKKPIKFDSLQIIHSIKITDKPFKFSEGKGIIKFIKQSCFDADLFTLKLEYNNEYIEVRNLLNAGFFEFDLDKNGTMEQYLYGSRNCSQELVILQIL